MPQQIKRLIVAFAVFILLFLVLRQVLRPKNFGISGHFREYAIQENSMKELHYTVSDSCYKCHGEIRADKAKGFHSKLKCEVCHGPGLKHALYAGIFKNGELPDSLKLYKPTERKECAVCHQINAARIKILFDTINNSMVHQINVMEHNPPDPATKELSRCIECHNPHQP
jgi:hypothetical protein